MSLQLTHLGFEKNFLKKNKIEFCLLSGDPTRTEMIGQNFLHNTKTLTNIRGLYCCYGETKNGKKVLAATSGMGAPSTSIVVNELIQAGIKTIIRIGTTGSLHKNITPGSIIINYASLCRQGAALDIAPVEYPAAATPELTVKLFEQAKKIHDKVYYGINASVDTFYEGQERYGGAHPHLLKKNQGIIEEYQNLNILNFEMETGTLFKMSGVYGFRVASICAVVAARYKTDQSKGEEIQGDIIQPTVDICVQSSLLAVDEIE